MNTVPLTPKQDQVFDYLKSFFAENDQLPPMKLIAWHFGWASENSVLVHMKALEKKGFIEKNAVGKYKFKRKESSYTAR